MWSNLRQRLRFEPAVVRDVIISVALLFGYELDAARVDEAVSPVFLIAAAAGPVVTAVWSRFKTRSKASLVVDEEPGVVEPVTP